MFSYMFYLALIYLALFAWHFIYYEVKIYSELRVQNYCMLQKFEPHQLQMKPCLLFLNKIVTFR